MSRELRHRLAVVLLALTGLIVAVVLGVVVSRAASQSVALGGAGPRDTGRLVITAPVTATTPTRTVTVTRTSSAPPGTSTTDDHGGDRDDGSRRGRGDGDRDADD